MKRLIVCILILSVLSIATATVFEWQGGEPAVQGDAYTEWCMGQPSVVFDVPSESRYLFPVVVKVMVRERIIP